MNSIIPGLKAKIIRVNIKKVETLYITDSPDIRGMIATARDEGELASKIPGVIKEMLDFVGGDWRVFEIENPDAAGAQYAFAAVPSNIADLEREALFLVERLREYESVCECEDATREWNGHVSPPLARLEALLSK